MSDETHASVADWTKRYFEGADSGELAFFDTFIDPEVRLQVANTEATIGRESLQAAFQAVSGLLTAIRHNVLDVVVSDADPVADHIAAVELSIDYTLKNGAELTLPCASFLKIKDGKAIEQKVFMDAAPLFAAMEG